MSKKRVLERDHPLHPDRSLMERLEVILEEEAPKPKCRLLCAAAAENRRWSQRKKEMFPVRMLIDLAEEFGAAIAKRCETLLPNVDYCSLSWTPSAVDHNNEVCRIKRSRPAYEFWR